MAWTKVGQNTYVSALSGGAVNHTLPGTPAEDDIVIVAMVSDATMVGAHEILTSGYTSIANANLNAPGHHVAYKIMGATPDTVIQVDDGNGVRLAAIVVQVWRGVDTTTPIDVTSVETTGTTGLPDCNSITPVTDGALVLAIGLLDDDDAAANVAAPTGYGDFLAGDTGLGSSVDGATAMIASKTLPTAQAEDPGAFQLTGGSGSDDWRAVTVALRPAAGGAPNAPTGLAKQNEGSDDANIVVAWTDNSSDESNFNLHRTAAGAGSWSTISANIASNATNYTDATVSGETGYEYRIRAENLTGNSSWNTSSVITSAPTRPSAFTASAGGNARELYVEWVDSSSAEAQYNIYHRINGSGDPYDVETSGSGTTNITLTGLASWRSYEVDVRAENSDGESGSDGTTVGTSQILSQACDAVVAAIAGLATDSEVEGGELIEVAHHLVHLLQQLIRVYGATHTSNVDAVITKYQDSHSDTIDDYQR